MWQTYDNWKMVLWKDRCIKRNVETQVNYDRLVIATVLMANVEKQEDTMVDTY